MSNSKTISGKVSYEELMTLINNNEIKSIRVQGDSDSLLVTKTDGTNLETVNPQSDTFIEELYKLGVTIDTQKTSVVASLLNFLMTVPPTVLMILLVINMTGFVLNSDDGFTLIRSKDLTVTFDQIQGLSETKKEVQFIVQSLNEWKKFQEAGARICKGILFYGPPGNGKTMLAKAIAKESGVNFINCSGGDFVQMLAGLGAMRIRHLFNLAKRNTPCIIFIDEIDCLGKRRSSDGDSVVSEYNQVLNTLLQRMDGVNSSNGIMVIGATNRKDDLDSALLRPGRFDRHYYIGAPDNKKDRDEVVNVYIKDKKLADNVTLEKVSKILVGFSGAEIENVINEAIFNSIMDNREGVISFRDIDEAIMHHYTAGVKKEHTSEKDLEIAAYHEAGHTLASLLLGIPISKVSVVPYSSGMGGVTIRDADIVQETKFKMQTDLEKELKILLAGKIAEELIYGEHSQGCSNDIEKATQLIYKMRVELGYDSKTLLNEKVLIANGLKHSLESRVIEDCNSLLKKFNDETKTMLNSNINTLKKIASTLITERTIVTPQLENFKG